MLPFLRQVLEVFTLPFDQILDAVHQWAALFIVLGVVSFVAQFLKVCYVRYTVAGVAS